jgi:hypothetical protein
MEEEAQQLVENDDELVAKTTKIYPKHSLSSLPSLLPTLFTLFPIVSSLLYPHAHFLRSSSSSPPPTDDMPFTLPVERENERE